MSQAASLVSSMIRQGIAVTEHFAHFSRLLLSFSPIYCFAEKRNKKMDQSSVWFSSIVNALSAILVGKYLPIGQVTKRDHRRSMNCSHATVENDISPLVRLQVPNAISARTLITSGHSENRSLNWHLVCWDQAKNKIGRDGSAFTFTDERKGYSPGCVNSSLWPGIAIMWTPKTWPQSYISCL